MSIFIKGMKMPKNCLKCSFCLFADGYWKCLVNGSHADFGGTCRPSLCPLVPVPPHGRLIDADALLMEINHEGMEAYMDGVCYGVHPSQEYLPLLGEIIDDAPTIIPADDGEPNMDEAMAEFAQYCEMYEPTYDPDTGAM